MCSKEVAFAIFKNLSVVLSCSTVPCQLAASRFQPGFFSRASIASAIVPRRKAASPNATRCSSASADQLAPSALAARPVFIQGRTNCAKGCRGKGYHRLRHATARHGLGARAAGRLGTRPGWKFRDQTGLRDLDALAVRPVQFEHHPIIFRFDRCAEPASVTAATAAKISGFIKMFSPLHCVVA